MATVVNFIDTTLESAATRTVNLPTAQVLLTPSAPAFHVATDGTITPASITFTVTQIDLDAPVTFNCAGGTLSNIAAGSADLAGADITGTSATVIASATVNGHTYTAPCTISKIQDGAPGGSGESGSHVTIAYLYQWAMSAPAKPNSTSTVLWPNGTNTSYLGSDGWSIGIPNNPSTPGIRLYVAQVGVSGAATDSSTVVSYGSSTVSAWSQNGANGVSGINSATATVYQWAATIPAGPIGSPTWSWSSMSFGAAPSGWSLTPGVTPAAGMTLWAASVQVTDSAANSSTAFNWSAAAVMAIGYAGQDAAGAAGSSYEVAYCASSTGNAASAPSPTTGKTSLPAANSGGITGTWSSTVPTLSVGQYLYQSDGIYDPSTDTITWSTPYWSSLKVATLSAITANLGAINAGSINLGGGTFTVDNDGNLVCHSIKIMNPDGSVMLQAGGQLNPVNAAPGTLNTQAAFTPFQTWEFQGSVQGWTFGNCSVTSSTTDTITVSASTSDPNIYAPVGIAINGAIYDKVRMRVRRIAGSTWQGEVYYSTSAHGASESYQKTVSADPTTGGAWTIVEWDLANLTAGGADWSSNTITGIRIDLGDSTSDVFEIDWIAIGKYGPAPSVSAVANAATTSTWGGVSDIPENLAGLTGSEGIVNSAITMNADGTLSGAGAGQVQSLPVVDTRSANAAPNTYSTCHIKELKYQTVIGIPGAAANTYCVLETLKGWGDASGGNALQWAYIDSGTVYKRSAPNDATSWGAWVRDLDTSVYTGDLNATLGADSSNLNVGIAAGNKIINSGPYPGDFGPFTLGYSDTGLPMNFNVSPDPYRPAGHGGVYIESDGTPANGKVCDIYDALRPVVAGQRYEFSAYMATHRCTGAVYCAWFKADGTTRSDTPYTTYGNVVPENLANGVALANYGRSVMFATAPSDAAFVMMVSRMLCTGQANPYLFTSMWYEGAALPSQSVPSEWSDGSSGSVRGLGYTGDLNASHGAPAGTPVGSTDAATVESNAAAGASANAAIPGINNAIADKLSKSAGNVMGGYIALATTGGIVSGSLQWDSNGNRTAGSGVAITYKGLLGYNSAGNPTIVLDASTGNIAISGDISGSHGTFSDVTIGSTMSMGQSAYNTGVGGWFQGGATPKMSMKTANGSTFLCDPGNNVMSMNGVTINNSTITTPFSISLSDVTLSGQANNTTVTTSVSPTFSSGSGNYSYQWAFTSSSGSSISMTNSPGASYATVSASGSNSYRVGYLALTVKDLNTGATASATCTVTIAFGSAVPP